jgi:hypothetical protein
LKKSIDFFDYKILFSKMEIIENSNLHTLSLSEKNPNKFFSRLDIDYDTEQADYTTQKVENESLKTDFSFKNNAIISWENINVYVKKEKKIKEIFRKIFKKKENKESEKDFLGMHLDTQAKIIENYLVLNKASFETESTQSGSSSSNNSSIDLNNKKNANRQILNQGKYINYSNKKGIKKNISK